MVAIVVHSRSFPLGRRALSFSAIRDMSSGAQAHPHRQEHQPHKGVAETILRFLRYQTFHQEPDEPGIDDVYLQLFSSDSHRLHTH